MSTNPASLKTKEPVPAAGKPLHFIAAALGSRGDLMPILWSALKLREAGHKVTVLANPFFAQDVAKCGLDMVPVGTAKEWIDHIADKRFWKQSTSFPLTSDLVDRSMYQFNEAMGKCGDYDAVIQGPLAFGAGMVAEKAGKPAITVHPSAYAFWMRRDIPVVDEGLGWLKHVTKNTPKPLLKAGFWLARKALNKMNNGLARINAFRTSIGLEPVKDFYNDAWVRPNLPHAGLFPDWYASKQPDWPNAFQTFDFPLSGLPQKELSKEVSDFVQAGEKPLVWTFGGDVAAEKYIGEAIKASRKLGKRALIISPNAKGMAEAAGGKDILYAKNVPYDKLLKNCAAFIHHGGVGTISYAVAAGVPQVIMPRIGDQHDNAYIASERLGVSKTIRPKNATEAGYVKVLSSVLGDKKMADCVKLCQKTMSEHSPKKDFAKWIVSQVKSPGEVQL